MDSKVIITMGIMALIGLLIANFKQFFSWIWSLVIDNVLYSLRIDEASQFFYGVQNFLIVEKPEKIKNFYYRTIYDNWIDGETTRDVQIFYNRGLIFCKVNGRFLLMLKTNTAITNSLTPYKNEKQCFQIIGFNKKVIDDFVNHVRIKYMTKNIRHYFNNNGEIMIYGNVNSKSFDNIFLNGTLKEEIIADLDRFNKSRELYIKLGLKYKRTYLFHGSAGNGKSSLATAIANYTRRDVVAVNISKDMTDSTLISLISKRPTKSIILFEDIDCLFEDLNRVQNSVQNGDINQNSVDIISTVNTDKKDSPMIKITLSCLLNILDGSFTPDDTIFVITTNHIDKLDPALKRDGRINMLLEIPPPDADTKRKYIEFVKKTNPELEIGKIDENTSMASLEKILF